MGKKISLIGKRFGRLLVLKESGRGKQGQVLWECICKCGNVVVVKGDLLKNGHTKSCDVCVKKN